MASLEENQNKRDLAFSRMVATWRAIQQYEGGVPRPPSLAAFDSDR